MARKSKAQIEAEIALALSVRHCVLFNAPGSSYWLYVTKDGRGTLNPDEGNDFGSREAAERAVEQMTGPRSGIRAKYATRKKPEPMR